jgi:hypothetical protein
MPAMGMHRGDRVHLSKRIDLMVDVQRVQWRARVGLKASKHRKSMQQWSMRARVMALVERPNWNRMKQVQWRVRVGPKATER